MDSSPFASLSGARIHLIQLSNFAGVAHFLEAQVRAKVSRAKTEMRTLDVALTAYHVDNGDYPPWSYPLGDVPYSLGGKGRVSQRYYRLTTPVAYITTIPKDPFSAFSYARDWAQKGDYRHIFDTYDYVNVITPGLNWPFDKLQNWGHWWRLNSFGPDHYNQNAGGLTGPFDVSLAAFSQFPNYIYDPTNGTVSLGDIVRVGPRCPQSKTPYHPIEQLQ